jgi:TonB family protein
VEKGYAAKAINRTTNFEIKSTITMSSLRKLVPILSLLCVHVWAQSPSAQGGDPARPVAQSSQAPQDSGAKALPDQSSSAPLPDSTRLETIKTQQPPYPDEAREQKLQGQVVVRAFVSETGDVEKVEEVSGDPILAKAAMDAVKNWKFKPFIKNGRPVKVSTKQSFNFAFSENTHNEADVKASEKQARIAPGVSLGFLTYKVDPTYPPEARQAGIQGTVILEAVISEKGTITKLHVVSGPKELVQAAMAAVQQWRYKPYLRMGYPVEVGTEVKVNFSLGRK